MPLDAGNGVLFTPVLRSGGGDRLLWRLCAAIIGTNGRSFPSAGTGGGMM